MGAGYLAVDRVEAGASRHRLGVALVRAAVDWRRAGLEVIPAATAAALVATYLPAQHRDDPGEDLTAATEWATDRVNDAVRLLEPNPSGWRAFDYLVDHYTAAGLPLPDRAWRELAAAEAPPGALAAVGYNAYQSDRLMEAEQLWRRAVDLGDAGAMSNLGVLLARRGETGEAEQLWRRAVDLGHAGAMSNLGNLLAERGETGEAEQLYRRAVDLGAAGAMSGG